MRLQAQIEAAAQERQPLRMSYEEFLAWANEDVHAEWIDGEVFVHMPPNDPHQRIVEFLERLLALFVQLFGLGIVRIAPFEMRIRTGGPGWEPDIFVVTREHLDRLTEDRLNGPADLVIEVVSPDSVQHDRMRKFRAYREGGVREYWMIDSRPGRERADFYRLDETGQYELFATEDDEKVYSTVLPGFWLRPAWLWQAEPPPVLMAFFEMANLPQALRAQVRQGLLAGLQPTETPASAGSDTAS